MMRRYLEIAYSSFYPESPLQMFASSLSRDLLLESLQLYLPGFPTALIILLDSLLVLCRIQSQRVVPGLSFYAAGLERSPRPLWPTTAFPSWTANLLRAVFLRLPETNCRSRDLAIQASRLAESRQYGSFSLVPAIARDSQ